MRGNNYNNNNRYNSNRGGHGRGGHRRGVKPGYNKYNNNNRYNNSNYYNNNNKYNNYKDNSNNNYNKNNNNSYNKFNPKYKNDDQYIQESLNSNEKDKDNNQNNNNYLHTENDNNNYYYEEEEEDNNNYYNNTEGQEQQPNKLEKYYNPNFKRHKGDDFARDTHKNQYKKKREYNRKLKKEEKEKENEEKEKKIKEEHEKFINDHIDPYYYSEENRIQEKLLDLEIKQEDEKNKEEIDKQREEIKDIIKKDYDKQMKNLTDITVKDRKDIVQNNETKFKKIIYNNQKLKNNPLLIYNIMEIFKAKKSSDEMQGEFIDLLGFDDISTIEEFITNRDEICESFDVAKSAVEANKKISLSQENLKLFGNTTVQTEVGKSKKKKGTFNELQKLQQENNQILEFLGFDRKFFIENNENINELNNNKIIGGNQIIENDDFNFQEINPVKKAFGDVGYNENIVNDKEIYQEKSIRKNNYVEIVVKNREKKREKTELKNVVKVLPKWAQKCFDFNFFNEIQSAVFDKSFYTDENILITAPTGAGKTNIALVTILREINRELKLKNMSEIPANFDFSSIVWDFKILFLVPLKALANEFLNKFTSQLGYFNLVINEFSGDVDLTKEQIDKTNLFVGIPEKWDLFTRKHDDVFKNLKLVIIDEVHLLNEDRGRVLECIVARTIRKCEILQKFIRFVGLSATLPNYYDVADFLRVKEGLFAFDSSYRATPLTMKFFGLKEKGSYEDYKDLENDLVYERVIKYLRKGKQVLVFVHSRMETIKFAKELYRLAQVNGDEDLFRYEINNETDKGENREYLKTNNKVLQEVIPYGLGFHNAGLLRKDRSIVEKLFQKRNIKVLVSTSTLAWGVNLPAYAVIIKGTSFYDASEGKKVDISILDIIQMFGRAGRPQYDKKGVGMIFCPISKLNYFVSKLKNQINIESVLEKYLSDSLNAEIAIGNISSIEDAKNWLKLTYLSVIKCGRKRDQNIKLIERMIKESFKILNEFKLIRYVSSTGRVHSTELGRIASNYYMSYKTISEFNEKLREDMFDEELLTLFSSSNEFANMKLYSEEKPELESLAKKFKLLTGNLTSKKSIEDIPKPIILLYTYLNGNYEFRNSSLFMDTMYLVDNSPRIFRAIAEISIHKRLVRTSFLALNYLKLIEHRIAPGHTPLWQFTYESQNNKISNKNKKYTKHSGQGYIDSDICRKMDAKGYTEISQLMTDHVKIIASDLSIRVDSLNEIKELIKHIPRFNIIVETKPLTRTILNITLTLEPKFKWSKKWNGLSENFWVIVNNNKEIIHHELFSFTPKKLDEERNKKYVPKLKEVVLSFAVPFDIERGKTHARLDSFYNISIISDKWVNCNQSTIIELSEIEVPQDEDVKTELLDLFPLPLSALKNKEYESVFNKEFQYFNPIQTQIFYSAYNSDENLLVGAPTGSGKTAIAELAILRLFSKTSEGKVIYIAPLKSLSKERVKDWKVKFAFLKKNVIELTGDFTPDLEILLKSDILITTPEKWDGISRNWHHRSYVKKVNLIIIDEIHLLGLDRGPIIEVIVSRMRYMCHKLKTPVRFIGLSTALANCLDVAEWLGIDTKYAKKSPPGLFNFRPAVRPCPVTVHIEGFSEKRYCPRMGTMNQPCFNAIINFSDNKPVLIFVSSRRQTRLTALDLIALSANHSLGDHLQYPFLKTSLKEINSYIELVQDDNLKNSLIYGIGLHHAGLIENDRKIVENLFLNQKILILIATSTLAWGVNFPAHLVIIKGTEYRDPKTCQYVDMPITDILQMIGRAGRPQYDNEAIACLFVKQDKKNFYKKFLYEPFPLESSLHKMLYDHINAEISSGMLTDKKQCIDYIKWTYFFKRLVKNPTYYGLSDAKDPKELNKFINKLLEKVLHELHDAGCIRILDNDGLESTYLGNYTSFYYMSYKTAKFYRDTLKGNLSIVEIINILTLADELSHVPVRHTEDEINKQMAQELPIKDPKFNYGKATTKGNLLIQAHLCRMEMPISDYRTDLKTVLDNCIRILLFMADIAREKNILDTLLNILNFIQMIMQGVWMDDCSLMCLPGITLNDCKKIIKYGKIEHLCEFCEYIKKLSQNKDNDDKKLSNKIKEFITDKCKVDSLDNEELDKLADVAMRLPILDINYKVYSLDQNTLERIYDRPIIENSDVQLSITLTKYNDINNNLLVYSRYPKIKNCRWFIIIGNIKTNEVLAFEKLAFKEKRNKKINFTAPKEIDEDSIKLFIMSDSYFGLDQEYNLNLKKINKGIMDKYGIIEIKPIKEVKDDKKVEKDDEDIEKETQKGDDEDEENDEDLYLENW